MHSGQSIEYSFPSKLLGREMALATKKAKRVLLCVERFVLVNNWKLTCNFLSFYKFWIFWINKLLWCFLSLLPAHRQPLKRNFKYRIQLIGYVSPPWACFFQTVSFTETEPLRKPPSTAASRHTQVLVIVGGPITSHTTPIKECECCLWLFLLHASQLSV